MSVAGDLGVGCLVFFAVRGMLRRRSGEDVARVGGEWSGGVVILVRAVGCAFEQTHGIALHEFVEHAAHFRRGSFHMSYDERVEPFMQQQLQPCHIDLCHSRTAPLSCFEHNDPDGLVLQPCLFKFLHEATLGAVEGQRDVFAAVFGFDAHISPRPVAEVVLTPEIFQSLHHLACSMSCLPGVCTDSTAADDATHHVITHHGFRQPYVAGLVVVDVHVCAMVEASFTSEWVESLLDVLVATLVFCEHFVDGRGCCLHFSYSCFSAKIRLSGHQNVSF